MDGHTDRVFAIANHPTNAHEFVSSGWDNTLQVCNIYLKIQTMTIILCIHFSHEKQHFFFLFSSGMSDVQIPFDLYMESLSVARVYRLIKEVKN